MGGLTELIYYKDPYVREFKAKVVDVKGDAVKLDVTAFYPESGGQPWDTGTLTWEGGKARVEKVLFEGDEVWHYVDHVPPKGVEVTGRIDWDRRYRLMRMHTAAHLLMAAVNEYFNKKVSVVGSGLDLDESRMDFNAKIKKDDLGKIEEIVNKWVEEGHDVRIHLFDSEERAREFLAKYGIQGGEIKEKRRPIRVIEIVGINADPCGGTHVRNTREVGRVRLIKRESKGKGVTRIRFTVD